MVYDISLSLVIAVRDKWFADEPYLSFPINDPYLSKAQPGECPQIIVGLKVWPDNRIIDGLLCDFPTIRAFIALRSQVSPLCED
jgi:hypothetical protein